jgi:hypothetical protein
MIERPESLEFFFRKGLTWPRRTTSGMSVRILPEGCIFADKGPTAFTQDLPCWLGLLQSSAFGLLTSIQLAAADAAARSYEVGLIQRTPVPSIPAQKSRELAERALSSVDIKRALDTANETGHAFHLPALLQVNGDRLGERGAAWHQRLVEVEHQLVANQRRIDDIAFELYRISDEDRRASEVSFKNNPSADASGIQFETDGELEEENAPADQRQLTTDFVSYSLGCALGRWDARFATLERLAPELPDPFAPLPICAPGALIGEDSLPLIEAPEGYPLRVDFDGILVDDPSNDDDIVRRVREIFELIWPKATDAREREACELLGVKELCDYFRKPTAGGFWMDHVRRYSKSRRKAPIYWLLRSSKGNYAIWLYYHRLDKDILYKALLNYVEPKLRLEENNLSQLRQGRETVGTTGREAKQLEKELDKQESFISELHDFHGKLKRAADLHLEPDLNDGVVLNIAPLWELVPWTEAKKYWKELADGKYDWSTISKQMKERNLIKT